MTPDDGGTGAAARADTTRYIPGLDGLRAIVVFGVLLYHGGFSWARGGFLGVSTFFTLSGFLITTLMLREVGSNGRLDFRHFWMRRARRLLPAALLTLAAVLVFHNAFSVLERTNLRGDVISAVAYVENWWLIHNHQTYGAIFSASSPVQHFWSLAIEEQFYLLFPFVFVGVRRLFRTPKSAATFFGAAAVCSIVYGSLLSHHGEPTRAYYSTFSRAGELLVGVVLAYVIARGNTARLRSNAALGAAGIASLLVLVVLWWRVDLHSIWLFPFGIGINALCTAIVITVCVAHAHLARFLSVAPLRRLGLISYGVYLVHWPIFLWLNDDRISVNQWLLFAIRLAATLAVAAVMYVVIESPIRHRTMLRGAEFVPVIALAMGAVIIGAIVVPAAASLAIDVNNPPSVRSQLSTVGAAHPPATTARALLIGDSVGWSVWVGLNDWGRQHQTDVQLDTAVGCGVGGPGTLRYLGLVRHTSPDCATWEDSMVDAVARYKPNVVLLVMGLADLSPRKFPDGTFRSIGDPVFDARLAERISSLTRKVGANGARVLWATYPHVKVQPELDGTGPPPFPENDPASRPVQCVVAEFDRRHSEYRHRRLRGVRVQPSGWRVQRQLPSRRRAPCGRIDEGSCVVVRPAAARPAMTNTVTTDTGTEELGAPPRSTLRSPQTLVVVGVFVLVRIAYWITGGGFSTLMFRASYQLLDVRQLAAHPIQSVFLLHIQPPLFNLLVGSVLRWSPISAALTFQFLYVASGLVLVVALRLLLIELGFNETAATIGACVVAVDPLLLAYEHTATYEYPVAMLLVVSGLLCAKYVATRRLAILAGFVVALTVIVLTRALLHPLWLVAAVLLVVVVARPHASWPRVVAVLAIPVVCIGAWTVKNQVLFGEPTLSSWFGMNLDRGVLATMPKADVDKLIAEHKLTPAAAVRPLSPYSLYEPFFGPCGTHFTEPVVRSVDKSYPGSNFNAVCYIPVYHDAQSNSIDAIKAEPGVYLERRWPSFVQHFSLAPAAYPAPGMERQGQNRVLKGLGYAFQPLLLPAGVRIDDRSWANPLFPNSPPYTVRLSLVLLAATLLVIIRGLLAIRDLLRRVHVPAATTWIYLSFTVFFVTAVSIATEYGENGRFRVMIDPILLGVLVAQIAALFTRRRNPVTSS